MSRTSSASEFTVHTTQDYFETLTKQISEARSGSRVIVMSMNFSPTELPVAELVAQLKIAAKKGANVKLIIDAHDFIVGEKLSLGPLFWRNKLSSNLKGEFGYKMTILDELKKVGVECAVINLPLQRFSLPVANRSHIKIGLVNDQVFIGGCNLSRTDSTDIMVGINDSAFATQIYELVNEITSSGNCLLAMDSKDKKLSINADTELMINAGIKNESLIMDNALRLIDEAEKSIFITCQYYPYGVTAKHLKAAYKRGVDVSVVYNNPLNHGFPRYLLQWPVALLQSLTMPRSFYKGKTLKGTNFVHAKLLVTEKASIIGSHNFVEVGVKLGTAEIALLSTNLEFGKQLIETLSGQLTNN